MIKFALKQTRTHTHTHTHTHKYSKELCPRTAPGLDDLKADNF